MTLKWALGGYMVRSWDRTYSSDTSDDAATIVASVGGGQDSQPSESYHILGDSGTCVHPICYCLRIVFNIGGVQICPSKTL